MIKLDRSLLIKPLLLGQTVFPVNLIQGPLAGVSCAPFRSLTWRYSKPAFSCTEMISCKTLIHQPIYFQQRFIHKDPKEGPVCFQLAGSDHQELAEAVKRVTQYGADLIDLNCGCPVKKIRNKGAGSRLLTDPSTLFKLITALKQSTHLPVSVKIRVEHQNEKFNAEVANVITEAGADFVVVHGRHWTEHYETPCRYEEIQFFVEALKIPVIGNGDVSCADSLTRLFATGCAGVMISRAGVGQPWLIGKLMADMRQDSFSIPTSNEIGLIFFEHIQALTVLLGNEKLAVLQARKLAKYYARHLVTKMKLCTDMNICESLSHFQQLCERYFSLDQA